MNSKVATYHDLIVLTVGRGSLVLAGFLTIKIATTLLSPDQLGSMNQMMSLATLGTSALLIPISAYIGRRCLEWRDAGVLADHLSAYFWSVVAVALLLGLVMWGVQSQSQLVSGVAPLWVGGLVTLYALGFSLYTMGATGLNLIGHRSLYVFFGNIAGWGGLVLAVLCLQITMTPEAWLLGIFSGFLLASLSYACLVRYNRPKVAVSSGVRSGLLAFDWWTVLMFAWPQAVVFALWWIQSQSYRFVLMWVSDIATVGLFAAGYVICSVPMQTFETLFNEFYSPTFFRALKGQDVVGTARAWNAYVEAYIPAVILFGAFLMGNVSLLVKLLLGEQFQSIAPILIWPVLTETFRAISSSMHQLGLAKVDMSVSVLPVLIGALVAPSLVYFLAAYDPLLGTACALLVAGVAVFAVIIPISYRALPVAWPARRILYAVVLGIPLVLQGRLMAVGFGEISEYTAVMALACSGLAMMGMQYFMSKAWLREVHLAKGRGV